MGRYLSWFFRLSDWHLDGLIYWHLNGALLHDFSLGPQDAWGWMAHLGTTAHTRHAVLVVEDWQTTFSVNVFGVVNILQAFTPGMLERALPSGRPSRLVATAVGRRVIKCRSQSKRAKKQPYLMTLRPTAR